MGSLRRVRHRDLSDEPQDDYAAFRQAVQFDLAQDINAGFVSAYFRSFATPDSARVLVASGAMQSDPLKRATDTGVVIYELIANGFDHARSMQMFELLRRVHKGLPVTADDYRYVLLSMLIVPYRWCARYGIRAWTAEEAAQGVAFFTELGDRIGIDRLPPTMAAMEAFFDQYETDTVRPSPDSHTLVLASLDVFRFQMTGPMRPLRFLAPQLLSATVEDPRICHALGIPPAARWTRSLLHTSATLRRTLNRITGPRRRVFFTPGAPVGAYPHGYRPSDVGPERTKL